MGLSAGKTALIGALGVSAALLFYGWNGRFFENPARIVRREIPAGATFTALAINSGLATSTAGEILEAAASVYDLAMISAGRDLIFEYDKETDTVKKMAYDINSDEQLIISLIADEDGDRWVAERKEIPYSVEIASEKGIIDESLYKTVVLQGLDQSLALALAEMFAWQIDFAGEIRKGDSFKVIYEKKYRDGKYDHVGKILAAEFINAGEKFQGFYFPGSETSVAEKQIRPALRDVAEVLLPGFSGAQTKEGYYDEKGNSLQKVFLKAPLQYKYISSGFTYRRVNPVTGNSVSPHRGIDYAALAGTPAVSVGDGTVIQAGWNGEYGISVKVRHNDTYTTVYGHFSGLAKGIRAGAKVRQGQIVGYVGSTGLSTGPHLHYEMHKFGAFINPFTEKVPSIEPVNQADKDDFEKIKSGYSAKLDELRTENYEL